MADRKPKSGRSPTAPEFLDLITDEIEAFKMRRGGARLSEIAAKQGISVSGASRRVKRGLEQAMLEHASEASTNLALELERLEDIIAGMWPMILAGDAKAAGAALKAMERKARLLGYEPPKEFTLKTTAEALAFAAEAMGLRFEDVAEAVGAK